MSQSDATSDEAAILARFDRSSADALLRSIASELARLHESNGRLRAKLASISGLAALADRIARAESEEFASHYPVSLLVEADYAFGGGVGFYEVEHDSEGQPFRWTGPGRRFGFELFVERGATAAFALTFDDFLVRRPIEELRCLVDGVPATLRIERRGQRYIAFGALPARADRGGSVITFICPQIGKLREPGQAEAREVGLRFRAFSIEPAAV